jgi:Mg2+ and Co2+ transporter CorA
METGEAIIGTLQRSTDGENAADALADLALAADRISTALLDEHGDCITERIAELASSARKIADAILPPGVAAGTDETGGRIESLTEAVMGVTGGLCKIADAISNLAEAVRDHHGTNGKHAVVS